MAKPVILRDERLKRLGEAVADLMESHSVQNRAVLRELHAMRGDLGLLRTEVGAMRAEVQSLGAEQALLANRVEDALQRAFRANLRMDDLEEERPDQT